MARKLGGGDVVKWKQNNVKKYQQSVKRNKIDWKIGKKIVKKLAEWSKG